MMTFAMMTLVIMTWAMTQESVDVLLHYCHFSTPPLPIQAKLISSGILPALLRLSLDDGGVPSGAVRERVLR